MTEDRGPWRGSRRSFGAVLAGAATAAAVGGCRLEPKEKILPIGDRGPIIIKSGSLDVDYGRSAEGDGGHRSSPPVTSFRLRLDVTF